MDSRIVAIKESTLPLPSSSVLALSGFRAETVCASRALASALLRDVSGKGASVNPVVTMRDLVMTPLIKFENHMSDTGRPVCAPSRAFLYRELADAGVADHSMAKQLDDRFLQKDRSRNAGSGRDLSHHRGIRINSAKPGNTSSVAARRDVYRTS